VISGAVFCPHPPVLIPDVAAGAAHELDALRRVCIDAIRAIARPNRQLVLLGSSARSATHSPLARGTMAGFGVPVEVHLGAPTCGGDLELPLSITVAAWLVREALGPRSGARGFSIGSDFAASRSATELLQVAESDDVALIVLGDGSARRTTAAPGYVDERAIPFDDGVADALRRADAAALEQLDEKVGAQLLAAGVPAWRVAGRLLDGAQYDSTLHYYDDPYGVAYLVASWIRSG
jgi:hypothetical protein